MRQTSITGALISTKHHITHIFAVTILTLLRGLKAIVRFLKPVTRPIYAGLVIVAHIFLRFVLFPLYSIFLLAKIRLEKTVVSARGALFFLFTNRYIFHILLFGIAIVTISSQFQTKQVAALDLGQNSMLYTLVTHGQDNTIQEQVNIQAIPVQTASYLSADTIQAVPGIDYDYDTNPSNAVDLTISGNIAVEPQTIIPSSSIEIASSEQPETNVEPTPVTVQPEQTPTERTGTSMYTVQSGDTVASIARRFSVNVGTIIWANDLTSRASIRPDDILKIPAASGVLYVVKAGDTLAKLARIYSVNASDIDTANQLPDERLEIGAEILIPGATPQADVSTPVQQPTQIAIAPSTPTPPPAAVDNSGGDDTTVNQDATDGSGTDSSDDTSDISDDSSVLAPSSDQTDDSGIVKPPDATDLNLSSKLLWPTVLHVINQYYGWRHTGVDIDGDYTDPIYAADDGVVESAGWNNGGYGLMIVIDHPNGFRTRYGHASRLFVKAGDHVKRGQVIAMIGTTGRSTGTHVHFEVYVNGVRVNPLGYIR